MLTAVKIWLSYYGWTQKRYFPWLIAIFAFMCGLSDVITTYWIFLLGGHELNPVLSFFPPGIEFIIITKILAYVLITFIALSFKGKYYRFYRFFVYWISALFWYMATISNCIQLGLI